MRVPKKNIYKILSDVKPPKTRGNIPAIDDSFEKVITKRHSKKTLFSKNYSDNYSHQQSTKSPHSPGSQNNIDYDLPQGEIMPPFIKKDEPVITLVKAKQKTGDRKIYKTIVTSLVALSLFTGLSYAVSVNQFRQEAIASADNIYHSFKNAALSLTAFNFDAAAGDLFSANQAASALRKSSESLGLAQIADIFGSLLPQLKTASDSIKSLEQLTGSAISINNQISELYSRGFDYFLSGEGDKFLPLLKNIQSNISTIVLESENISRAAAGFQATGQVNFGQIMSLRSELMALEDILSSSISFLDSEDEKHWLVLFQNASEIRATGGFIGSFAHVSIANGALKDIKVVDIYDPDGQLDSNLTPPFPLQAITPEWGARDANWFFDFKDSAELVASFLNESKIYSEQNIVFEGVTAINTNVLESILGMTGGINLPEYDMIITQDNFLSELQYEVEIRRTKDRGQPKTVLKDLVPLVINKIGNFNPVQKEALATILQTHHDRKDIMWYSSDSKLQSFFERQRVAGRVMSTPSNFSGDYLAVVNTNIAGGKTDAVIEEKIFLLSEISTTGSIKNYLTIERSHIGQDHQDQWYKTHNQNYLRVLSPLGSRLLKITGATTKNITPPKNYSQLGYDIHPKLSLLENQKVESGKTVFDAWLTTLMGQTKEIRFEYDLPHRLLLFDGQTHLFIFEKQSGASNSSLSYTVEAPPGFRWAENNGTSYTLNLKPNEIPARLVLPLTLRQI